MCINKDYKFLMIYLANTRMALEINLSGFLLIYGNCGGGFEIMFAWFRDLGMTCGC